MPPRSHTVQTRVVSGVSSVRATGVLVNCKLRVSDVGGGGQLPSPVYRPCRTQKGKVRSLPDQGYFPCLDACAGNFCNGGQAMAMPA